MQRISITNPQNIIDGTAKKYYFKLRNTGGPKGDKGDKGDTGQTGPQGPKGDAATVAIGSTTTLPVGYDATVENVGSIYNAVLNFGIPQGPQGPQGAKGDKGDTGAQGETGPRGPQGDKGTNATVYVGTTTTTNPGTQARVYNSGTDSNAVLNFEIPRGDVGPMPTIAQTTGQAIDQVMSQKATTDALATKQNTIDSSHKLSADLVIDTTTTNKFVTASDKTTWNAKQNALTAGDNITISGDTISATDTTYTAGNNIDITGTTISTPAIAPEVVAELPATGTEGKLYLTPKNYTRGTGTGNPIEATVTEEAGKMESFQLDGDTYQQTYTGKNLIGAVEQSYSSYGITNTLEPDGAIKCSGKCEQTYFQITRQTVDSGVASATPCNIPAGSYTLSLVNPTSAINIVLRLYYSTSSSDYNQFTLSKSNQSASVTIASPAVMFYIWGGGTTVGQDIDITMKLQLESGGSATSFEPYVGGVPSPNPDYPQQIQTVTGEQTVEIVGKNLAQPLDKYTYDRNGSATIESQSDGTVVFATSTSSASSGVYIYKTNGNNATLCPELFTAGFVVSFDVVATVTCTFEFGVTGNHTTTTVSTTKQRVSVATATGAGMVFYNNSQNGATITISNIQVEAGSTASSFAPYSKQTLPINLGKNLFDKDTAVILTGELNSDKTYSTSSGKTIYIKCNPNTTYSVQKADIGNRARLGTSTGYLPNGGTATNYVAMGTVASGKRYGQITSGQNDRFLWFTFARDDDAEEIITRVINSIQIEAGAQYSSYAPYKTPIELCKLGTYQDYIYKDGDSWKIRKRILPIVMDGNTRIKPNQFGTNSYAISISQQVVRADSQLSSVCEFFYGIKYNDRAQEIPNSTFIADATGQVRVIIVRNTGFTTSEALSSWFDTYRPKFYCSATSSDTTITDTDLIAQLEAIRTASLENGTNTITNTAAGSNLAGDMEVGYYGYNPTNRYDKWLWLDLNNNYEQIGS